MEFCFLLEAETLLVLPDINFIASKMKSPYKTETHCIRKVFFY